MFKKGDDYGRRTEVEEKGGNYGIKKKKKCQCQNGSVAPNCVNKTNNPSLLNTPEGKRKKKKERN